jgi:hypothetical protein
MHKEFWNVEVDGEKEFLHQPFKILARVIFGATTDTGLPLVRG